MNFKFLRAEKGFISFLDKIIFILTAIASIPVAFSSNETGVIVFTVPVIVAFIFSMAMKVFVMKSFRGKIAWYVFDGILLVLLTLFSNWKNESGNLITFNYIVYALVLSEFYLSSDRFKDNVIMFAVNIGMYTVAYIIVATMNDFLASAFRTAAQYFTDLIILLLHFAIFNFAMTVYRKNRTIEQKVRELEESRNELLHAYDKLEEATLIEERNRIAKEIHDTAGHSLTTVIMQTEAAKLNIEKNPKEALYCINAANLQAKNCLDELRLSVHLLSGRNENVSFKEYLEGILNETSDGTNITVRSKIDDIVLSEKAERFISNTLREGISNGIRHGKSTAFFFELKDMGTYVEFLLSDNGCGVNMQDFKEGFGLSGIHAKTEEMGGMIRFSSEEGEGFEIIISLPQSVKGGNKHED